MMPTDFRGSNAINKKKHGIENVFDGVWNHGYFSTLGESLSVQMWFGRRHPVRKLVLFEEGHGVGCPEVVLEQGGARSQLVCLDSYQHQTSVHRTTAWVYTMKDDELADEVSMEVLRKGARLVALREIAFLGPREEDYQQLLKSTSDTLEKLGY